MADNSLPKVAEEALHIAAMENVTHVRVVSTDNSERLPISNLTIAGTKVTVAIDGLSGTVDGAFGDVLTAIAEKADTTQVEALDAEKVDKVTGKSLILDTEISRLSTVTNQTKQTLGLENVDNTSDLNKPVSTATQTALNGKVNTTDIEQVRSQATNKVASSKLLDDELTVFEDELGNIDDVLDILNGDLEDDVQEIIDNMSGV